MEEPPEHVMFILATTELHKVPATIVSRCQQFDFRRIRPADIERRLSYVAEQEAVTLTPEAASLIARLSDGGMRDALSLLDQCIAVIDPVTADVVAETAGVAGKEQLFALSRAILDKDTAAALNTVTTLYENAKGVERITSELTAHFRDIMLCRSVTDPGKLIVCLPDELERLCKMAASTSLDRILQILGELQRCTEALGRAGDKKVELEMTIIKLCSDLGSPAQTSAPQAAPSPDTAALQQRIDQLERLVAQLSAAPVQPAVPLPVQNAPETAKPQPVQPPSAPTRQPAVPKREAPLPAPPQPPAEPADSPAEPLPQWAELLTEMEASEPILYSILEGSTAVRQGKTVVISSENKMLKKMLLTDNIGAKLADLVEQKLGSRHRLRIATKAQTADQKPASPAFADILSRAAGEGVDVRLDQ
jgi:DNA polymerase-3 subunit gamma/tau